MFARYMMTFLMLGCSALCAGGVFAYKNHSFHDEKDAILILYTTVEVKSPVTWVVSGGKRYRFEASQPHEWVDLPTALPDNLVLPHQTSSVSEKVREIRKFAEKYPKSAKACESALQLQVSAEDKLKAGEVRYQGEWMTREAYGEIVAARKREDEMTQAALVKAREDRIRLEEEKVKLEESIRAKERAAKEALRFSLVQAVETEIQSIEAENTSLKSKIRDRFSDISKIIIENHL